MRQLVEPWGLSPGGAALLYTAQPPLNWDYLLALRSDRAQLKAVLATGVALKDWKIIEREVCKDLFLVARVAACGPWLRSYSRRWSESLPTS